MQPTHNMGSIEVNRLYVAEGCGDLPVHQTGALRVSCWELSIEEIMKVMETGRIYLGIYGCQPPVFLSADEKEVKASIAEALE